MTSQPRHSAAGFGENRLLLAAEVLQLADPEVNDDSWFDGSVTYDRPPADWEQAAELLLARVQLDQMLQLVTLITEIDDPLSDPEATKQALIDACAANRAAQEERHRAAGGDPPDEWEFEKCCVLEAIDLRLALPADPTIFHAFTFDGSITLTLGPSFPACGALGLRGGDGEMLDEPRDILEAARRATTCAGELAHALGSG